MDLYLRHLGHLFEARDRARLHRFMESADINAAFTEMFAHLRRNIRRGMTTEGQVYALEMDTCLPGELLDVEWIPLPARGIVDARVLADDARRRHLFDQLLGEPRAQALFAFVCERENTSGVPGLYLELVSADDAFVAHYPFCAGNGWHRRDLIQVPHRRLRRAETG
jgi:hypothetical protein